MYLLEKAEKGGFKVDIIGWMEKTKNLQVAA